MVIYYNILDVDENTRKSAVKDALMKYRDWENETLSFYERKFKELSDLGCIAYTNKVMNLIKNIDEELKCITRMILKYKASDWNMAIIEHEQDGLHECYKNKTKDIGIDIC